MSNNINKNHYRTIVLSDLHIGSRGCKHELLNNFLDHNTSDLLYLNGDIIDAWKIQQNNWVFSAGQGLVVVKLLQRALSETTKVTYIIGNHDEFLRELLTHNVTFSRINLCNETIHQGLNGKQYIVTHGDLFDEVTTMYKWLSFTGDRAYDFLITFNHCWNKLRKLFGFEYYSLSGYLKTKVKNAINFIYQYERSLIEYCKIKTFNDKHMDGILCGHIHVAEIKDVDGITYMNSGDWVESCTALVETMEGEWKIVVWNKIKKIKNTNSNRYVAAKH